MEIENNIFYDEFKNKLINLENTLNEIQNGNNSKENINEVFRSLHTIKGTADLLYMFDIVRLVHQSEDLLEYIRDDKLTMYGELCSLFIEFKNYISLVVDNTSYGIFDDSKADELSVYFEKEFNKYIQRSLNQEIEEERVKNILVVESSALIRYTIKKIGKDAGFNVIISDNGKAGLSKLENNDIDILFCDLNTPNIGVEMMIEDLKNNLEYDFLPIVVLVDNHRQDTINKAKKLGANAWLTKPLDQNKFLLILEKLLN